MLWTALRELEKNAEFQAAKGAMLHQISAAGKSQEEQAKDAVAFFRFPQEFLAQIPPQQWWSQLLRPLIEALETNIKRVQPADLKGTVKFASTPDGAFGILYML